MYHLIAVQRLLQINPFGNNKMTNTTNQRHYCETILPRAKTTQAGSKRFDLSSFTDLNKSAITCVNIILNNIHLIRREPLLPSEQTHLNKVKDENKCLLGRNTSHSTGRISAQQFHCSTMMSGGEAAPGFLSG